MDGLFGLLGFAYETHRRREDVTHRTASDVRCQENHAARKIDFLVVAQGQPRLVENTEKKLPQGIVGLLDLIEEQQRKRSFRSLVAGDVCRRKIGAGFLMTQVSRRRTDQPRYFVAMAELGTVYLEHRAAIAKATLGQCFHQIRLAGPRRSQEQKGTKRAVWAGKAGMIDLEGLKDGFYRLLLSDDPISESQPHLLYLRSQMVRGEALCGLTGKL